MGGAELPAEPSADLSSELVVELLDAALGRAVKVWQFRDRQQISIGRMPQSDVEINDPYVSRLHAELLCQEGRWRIIAHGRHGLVVRNRQVSEWNLDSDETFQLGASGPTLRVRQCSSESADCGRTLSFDSEPLPMIVVDETKLQMDVGQITDGDYFQKLRAQAESLRARRRD